MNDPIENASESTATPAPTPTAPTADATAVEPAPMPSTSSRRGRVRLDRLAHVRRQLGVVYRDLQGWAPEGLKASDRIARARALAGILSTLADVLRTDELDRRLTALEEMLRGGGDPN